MPRMTPSDAEASVVCFGGVGGGVDGGVGRWCLGDTDDGDKGRRLCRTAVTGSRYFKRISPKNDHQGKKVENSRIS